MEIESSDEAETASIPSQSSDTHGPATPTDNDKRRLSALASIDILSATIPTTKELPPPPKANIKTPLSDIQRSPRAPPGIRRRDVSDAISTLEEIIENVDDETPV